MDIKKSSYYRIFRFTVFLVLSVMIIVGVISVGISSAVYKKAKLEALESEGGIFIECIKNDDFTENEIQILMNSFYSDNGTLVYIFDSDKNCIMQNNSEIPDKSITEHSGEEAYLGVMSKDISSKRPYMLYITRFFLKSDSVENQQAYAVFCGDTQDIDDFTLKVTTCYATVSLIAFLFVYVLMKRRTKRFMEYESKLVEISGKYAKGDFSEKIPDDSSGNLAELAKHINSLASDVETSEETSKTFMSNVSHELRTPITTIGGFVGGILDGTIKKSQQTEYLDLVHKEIQRLAILISSMLNMSRFESGTLTPNFKETNLTDLVIQIVLMFEKKIEEKHLEIEELDSSRLIAVVDSNLMQQVIYNLVENAVKFVNEGGTLSFVFEEKDGTCIVGIRNTGDGLKDEEIQQVFDRFYKTDSSRGKDKTGLGLGLSISRKIVHLHKGHIVVKSVYGEYTEFQIQIPRDLTAGKG